MFTKGNSYIESNTCREQNSGTDERKKSYSYDEINESIGNTFVKTNESQDFGQNKRDFSIE